MNTTPIQWTDKSLNPIRARRIDGKNRVPGHFCQKISTGCTFCYASKMQPRFGMPFFPGTNKSPADMGLEFYLDEAVLQSVLRVKKPCKIFWCDMSDMFGDWVPFEWIDECFAVMALTPHLTHQILTKRPGRMAEYTLSRTAIDDSGKYDRMPQWYQQATRWLDEGYGGGRFFDTEKEWDRAEDALAKGDPADVLKNVWLGTSCENQETADERIPHLLQCQAAVRFLSCEPLLGPIDLANIRHADGERVTDCLLGETTYLPSTCIETGGGIHWIIAGGESGHKARPCNIEWIRNIVGQCKTASVACFVKQLGADQYYDPPVMGLAQVGMGTKPRRDPKGGDPAEWPADLRVREMPGIKKGQSA